MVAVAGNINILLITETEIDSTLIYVRDGVRSRIDECETLPRTFESLVLELSYNLKKCLLICSYNHHKKI